MFLSNLSFKVNLGLRLSLHGSHVYAWTHQDLRAAEPPPLSPSHTGDARASGKDSWDGKGFEKVKKLPILGNHMPVPFNVQFVVTLALRCRA